MQVHVPLRRRDWAYLAEGNSHAVLRYIGEDVESPFYKMVLKLPKVGAGVDIDRTELYLARVMDPYYTKAYMPTAHKYPCSCEFILAISTDIETLRPVGRREKQLNISASFAILETDLSVFFPLTPIFNSSDKIICVEIKVKCGLKSVSPFLYRKCQLLKLEMTRYDIMQHFKCSEDKVGVLTPWGTRVEHVSRYDPSKLCSGERVYVLEALQDLLLSPQNNFMVYENGIRTYGLDSLDMNKFLSNVCDFFDATCPTDACESLLDICSNILCQEDILQRVQALQALDLLDVEGASLVFNRFSQIIGDTDVALQQIDGFMAKYQLFWESLSMISHRMTCSSTVKNNFLHKIEHLRNNYSDDVVNIINIECRLLNDLAIFGAMSAESDAELESRFTLVMSWVNELNSIDCLCLLRLWLISLAASDTSIMIRISAESMVLSAEENIECGDKTAISSGEELGGAGFVYTEKKMQNRRRFKYAISVSDIGPKPATKIISKAALEDKIIMSLIPT